MQHPSQSSCPTQSKFPVIVLTLCLGLQATARVHAASDPSDTQSVTLGAQLYELYCSDCHGSDTTQHYDALYDSGTTDVSEEYAELIDIVRGVEAPEPYQVEEDWPEWAENPAPEREPDVREEVLGTVSQAIAQAHGLSPEAQTQGARGDQVGVGDTDRIDPLPGATNLADPTSYAYGTSEEDLFNSIANGTGTAMPGWRSELGSDEAIWDLVNYIRSLWGEEWQY
jgi:mono/diheme cytochrome c family protein